MANSSLIDEETKTRLGKERVKDQDWNPASLDSDFLLLPWVVLPPSPGEVRFFQTEGRRRAKASHRVMGNGGLLCGTEWMGHPGGRVRRSNDTLESCTDLQYVEATPGNSHIPSTKIVISNSWIQVMGMDRGSLKQVRQALESEWDVNSAFINQWL